MQADSAEHREGRERRFWDENVPSVADCVLEYREGPDPNSALMLDALEPLRGKRVLDFACGVGVTSAWLADRGASVVGLDLSPESVARAGEFCRAVGADARFVAGSLDSVDLGTEVFDGIVGRYALHHVDCRVVGPQLAARIRDGGVAAFLETMDSNPLLRLARRHLTGRLGIPRLGTLDEHPLTADDLAMLRRAFGELRLEVAELTFLRIFDRQVLRYGSARVSSALGALDDLLARVGWTAGSYQQVVVMTRHGG